MAIKSGILLVDKPVDLTSAAVVAKIKRKFGYDKIGHGGTLDPFASGLLVLLIGEATKIARFLLEGKKSYECMGNIGAETDTGDCTGVLEIPPSDVPSPTEDEWILNSKKFVGKIQQIPPQYSAIKKAGRPLYDYARKGEFVAVEAREVEIYTLDQIQLLNEKKNIRFHVECSGGTYIRSLMVDWARSVHSFAHLQELRRIESMEYSVQNAYTLADLLNFESGKMPELISLTEALKHLPQVFCTSEEAADIRMGRQQVLQQISKQQEFTPQENSFFLLLEKVGTTSQALAILSAQEALLRIERVFDRSATL